jgi:hypothetical protein
MRISHWPKLSHASTENFCVHARNKGNCNRSVLPVIFSQPIHAPMLMILFSFRTLLSASSLSIIRTLLDQKAHDDLRVMGCLMLVDFLNGQVAYITRRHLHLLIIGIVIYLTLGTFCRLTAHICLI